MTSEKQTTLQELQALNDLAETDEDHAFIARHIEALENADRSTAQQKATLERLTQQASAWLVSYTSRTLRDHGAARNADQSYNARDLVEWVVSKRIEEARKNWERDNDKIDTAKERQEAAKAIKLEEQAKSVQDSYVLKDDARLDFMEMAGCVRQELESLAKSMENDFPAELRASLVLELNNQVRQILRRLANRGSKYAT